MVETSFGTYDDEEATDSHGPPNCTYLPTYLPAYLGVSSVILETESVRLLRHLKDRGQNKNLCGLAHSGQNCGPCSP